MITDSKGRKLASVPLWNTKQLMVFEGDIWEKNMERLTENATMTFFNRTEESGDYSDYSQVMICYEGVHFELTSIGNCEDPENRLVVVGTCNSSCKKAYHKKDLLLSVLIEQMIKDTESQIRIFLDFPKLAHNFLEKGIIGESSLGYTYERGTGWSSDAEIATPVVTRP